METFTAVARHTDEERQLNVLVYNILPSGHGHKSVTFDILYRGRKKSIKRVSNDMEMFDNLEDRQDLVDSLLGSIEDAHDIFDWTMEVDEEIENC